MQKLTQVHVGERAVDLKPVPVWALCSSFPEKIITFFMCVNQNILVCVWMSDESLEGSVSSFHHVDPRVQLGQQAQKHILHPPSHLGVPSSHL